MHLTLFSIKINIDDLASLAALSAIMLMVVTRLGRALASFP